MSLFHPRAFEFAVIDFIEDRFINYPDRYWEGQPVEVVRAPIDWQPFDHLPGPAVFFHVDTGSSSASNYYFATTLDDNDLLFLGFTLHPSQLGPKHIPAEEWVDQRNMKRLMFDIFNSLELELSPQAEAHRRKAIAGLDDTSLKKTMETQSFTYRPEDKSAEHLLKKGP